MSSLAFSFGYCSSLYRSFFSNFILSISSWNIAFRDKIWKSRLQGEGLSKREAKWFDSQWSPTGKPVVPQNHTHLRQGFGGSSAGDRNPPKHDRLIAEMVYRALTHSSTAKAVVSCVGGWGSRIYINRLEVKSFLSTKSLGNKCVSKFMNRRTKSGPCYKIWTKYIPMVINFT